MLSNQKFTQPKLTRWMVTYLPHKNCRSVYLCSSPKLFLLHEELEEELLLEKEDQSQENYPQPANPSWILCASQKMNQNGWTDQPNDGNLPAPKTKAHKSNCK